jgi:transposase
MLEMHLTHVDHLTDSIARLDTEVDKVTAPFGEQARALQTHPRCGQAHRGGHRGRDRRRYEPLSERRPRLLGGHVPRQSRERRQASLGTGSQGRRALRSALCEAAWAAARTKDTYLAAQFRHLRRRFGKGGDNKAIFAVGHSILVIAWHLLTKDCDYEDLGGDYFGRRSDAEARTRYLIRQLHALGHQVILEPAA